MLINHGKKFILVAVPKTGSTSLYHGIRRYIGENSNFLCGAAALYHLPAHDIRLILGSKVYDSYHSYGVVRNPYDRLVSLYHDFKDQRNMIKAKSFSEFVENGLGEHWKNNVHFQPQSYFLCDHNGSQIVSRVFKFEEGVSKIMDQLGSLIGFEVGKIGHARKSTRGAWQDYYENRKLCNIVNEVYTQDFEAFGYRMIV